MRQEIHLDVEKISIGEKILIASDVARLGNKPGLLDRVLGEKNVRRIIIDGEYVDLESSEYKQRCENAYDEFKAKYRNEDLFNKKLLQVNRIYNLALRKAEKGDRIKWPVVFANFLLLGSNLRANQTSESELNGLVAGNRIEPTSISLQGMIGTEELHKRSPFEDSSRSYAANIASTSVKTFGDSISWLNERSDGIPYVIATFAASKMMGAAPATAATSSIITGLFSFFTGAKAVKVGDEDYQTTIYCGPEVECGHLRDAARNKKIDLIEIDQKQTIKDERYKKVKRLIVVAHSNSKGMQNLIHNSLVMQPDDFAAKFFPNVKAVHALGCMIGANPQQNFDINSLKSGQILFLHAGSEDTSPAINSQILSFLSLEPNPKFPSTTPLQIIFKKSAAESVFAELVPVPLQEIVDVVDDESRIDRLYELIARHIILQKKSTLEQFAIDPKAKTMIASELERLGFQDFTKETDLTKKEEFVRNYLGQYLFSIASHQKISPSELKNIKTIIRSGLADVNYICNNESSISYLAAQNGHDKYLEILAENGADLNKLHDGESPAFTAAKNGHHKCLEVLAKYKADLNEADKLGTTPILMATQKGYHECLEVLAKNGADLDREDDGTNLALRAAQKGYHKCLKVLAKYKADLNKPQHDGSTAVLMAVQQGHLNCLKTLVENKADLDKVNNVGTTPLILAINIYKQNSDPKYRDLIIFLVRSGANPELNTKFQTAYQFAGKDQDLIREMKKARGEYIESQKKDQESPGTSPKKPVALHNSREL